MAAHDPSLRWPIAASNLTRVGDSLLAKRRGTNEPHHGIDLYAPAGTQVLSASDGVVLRVVDGSAGRKTSLKRAGLYVDILDDVGRVHRYLHLGSALVGAKQVVRRGNRIGTVAAIGGGSGVNHSRPHLHYEIRLWDYRDGTYGIPEDPLALLGPIFSARS